MTGIEPALSAWELDRHAPAEQHVAGQPLCPVVPEYPLSTNRPPIGHAPTRGSRLGLRVKLAIRGCGFDASDDAVVPESRFGLDLAEPGFGQHLGQLPARVLPAARRP